MSSIKGIGQSDNARVVVIEDDANILELYVFKLKKAGFKVETAANGIDGLSLVKKFKPDLILLDILMPEMNGDEMLEELRKFDWSKNIKVIILTNISKDEAPSKLRLLSVDRYIVKAHYTPAQVVDMVREVLGS